MKHLSIILLLLALPLGLQASPAKRGIWKTVKTADGKTISVELRGDEHLHFYQSQDGTRYVKQGETYVVANMEALRKVSHARRSADLSGSQATDNGLMRAAGQGQTLQKAASYTGTKRCLILLVQFSDQSFSMDDPKAFYTRVANEENFSEGDYRGSLHDYFHDQSNGQFNIQFDIVGPYTLGATATYGGNDDNGSDKNARLMVSTACQKAYDEGTDFTPYDWDGDGYVDMVYVIYAGRGEASGGDDDTIWPHKWVLNPSLKLGDKTVYTYACSNEMRTNTQVAGIGTVCHEFSHCLGYPDVYDTDYAENGQYYGMGTWDLMSSGSYNGNEFCPAGYTAYEKMAAGWITPVELTENTTVTDMTPIADGGKAYKITNPNYSNEYYLIENRQLSGWDSQLAAGGILINYIDYSRSVWSANVPNTIGTYNDHERITIFAADNVKSSTTEKGDPWPNGNNDTFDNTSSPSASLYHENTDGTKLMNIRVANMAVDDDGVASFTFTNFNNGASQEGYLLHETFDKCQGTGGNDTNGFTPPALARNFANGTFNSDVEGWSSNYSRGGYQCARFGNGNSSGAATSPAITLNGTPVTLTFKAAPYGTDGTSLTLSTSGEATLSQTAFTMTKDQWTEFSTTITGTGEVQIVFTPTKRFFLDEVSVPSPTTTGINTIKVQAPSTRKGIYSIDGRYLGVDLQPLPKGVYVVNGRKVVK